MVLVSFASRCGISLKIRLKLQAIVYAFAATCPLLTDIAWYGSTVWVGYNFFILKCQCANVKIIAKDASWLKFLKISTGCKVPHGRYWIPISLDPHIIGSPYHWIPISIRHFRKPTVTVCPKSLGHILAIIKSMNKYSTYSLGCANQGEDIKIFGTYCNCFRMEEVLRKK